MCRYLNCFLVKCRYIGTIVEETVQLLRNFFYNNRCHTNHNNMYISVLVGITFGITFKLRTNKTRTITEHNHQSCDIRAQESPYTYLPPNFNPFFTTLLSDKHQKLLLYRIAVPFSSLKLTAL
jgi:hypothetical protein